MKRFGTVILILTLALQGCSEPKQSVASGRDMKLLLDDKGVDCTSFDVTDDLVTNAEILTCLDGSVKNQPFSFLIWPTTAERNLAFTHFCMDLKRRGGAEDDLIVEDTWVAYSESSFFPPQVLAEELGAEVISGERFCLDRGFEIGEVLSAEGIQACNRVEELYQESNAISISEKLLVTSETLGVEGIFNGQMGNVDKETLIRIKDELREELRKLLADVPMEISLAAREVNPAQLYSAAMKHENGTAPLYFFLDIPQWKKDKPITTRADQQRFLEEINQQYIEHNRWVADFNVEHSLFNLSVAKVLDACSLHAPFEWAGSSNGT